MQVDILGRKSAKLLWSCNFKRQD